MKALSADSMAAFQDKADEETCEAIVAWAKEALADQAGRLSDEILAARVKATVAWGQARRMKSRRELALLFGVLLAVDARLARAPAFRDSLQSLRERQRCELLYDLLTGSAFPPPPEGPLPAASDDWSKLFS